MTLDFVADKERQPDHLHVLLVATGSVASIKVPLLVKALLDYARVKVEVIATKHSVAFFDIAAVKKSGSRVWLDEDEWRPEYKIGDPILHIELRRWADVVLIAPCSANTLAKIANGLCDNLATSVLRALPPVIPTFVFPAMNTMMFEHPLTKQHLDTITNVVHYTVVGPVEKQLACNDTGTGAMTDWRDIIALVVEKFGLVSANDPADSST